MTATVFSEFQKIYNKLPKDRLKNIPFIPLRSGTKIPEVIGSWKEKQNQINMYGVKKRLNSGKNYAIVARVGGIMFLDIDAENGNVKATQEILAQIPETLMVKTRSGGLHYYFLNEGQFPNQLFKIGNSNIGELRVNWQYIVGAGSWVEPATYKVISDLPIAEFKGEITKFFEKSEIKEEKDTAPKELHGKKAKPNTPEIEAMIKNSRRTSEKEERRRQLLEYLKTRYV